MITKKYQLQVTLYTCIILDLDMCGVVGKRCASDLNFTGLRPSLTTRQIKIYFRGY